MKNVTTVEQAIIQAGADKATRVTPADIEANIVDEVYFTGAQGCNAEESNDPVLWSLDQLGLMTFCVLVLKNGFTVTGESACVSPENFNAAIGRKIARENAITNIWPLMGYELRCKLSNA
jgi:hypothetical protein